MTAIDRDDALRAALARHIEAVVIGASAGGFEALMAVLGGLPADYPSPVSIVLHLPDNRDSRLAELFGYRLAMDVREARDKEPLAPGTVYFAPPGYHLRAVVVKAHPVDEGPVFG